MARGPHCTAAGRYPQPTSDRSEPLLLWSGLQSRVCEPNQVYLLGLAKGRRCRIFFFSPLSSYVDRREEPAVRRLCSFHDRMQRPATASLNNKVPWVHWCGGRVVVCGGGLGSPLGRLQAQRRRALRACCCPWIRPRPDLQLGGGVRGALCISCTSPQRVHARMLVSYMAGEKSEAGPDGHVNKLNKPSC